MPALNPQDQTEDNKVHGCVSQVWLKTSFGTNEQGEKTLKFLGDSDALIVRGLVAILRIMLNEQTVKYVSQLDAIGALGELGLNEHLTPQRSNGLTSMIKRLQGDARAAL